MIWHGGFPLLVICYALLKAGDVEQTDTGPARHGNHQEHPRGRCCDGRIHLARHRPARPAADPAERRPLHTHHAGRGLDRWCLSFAALAMLWFRRPHAVLDVWLMVVMSVWLFDIALVGDPERRALRPRFLSRSHLRPWPPVWCSPSCWSKMPACRPGWSACSATFAGKPRPSDAFAANAKACSARSWNHPTMPSSPNCLTAPSPAGTAPPNACSDTRRWKRSARTSTSSFRRSGATKYAASSNGSVAANRSSTMRRRACARTAASSTFR